MFLFACLPYTPVSTTFCAAVLVLFAVMIFCCPGIAEENSSPLRTVFRDGDGDYPRFRIPALLCLPDGTLLAFAEGRRPHLEGQHDDHARNNIVLRRSEDGGETWGPVQVVAAQGDDSLNDPCVVLLPDSSRVLLMYQRFPQGYHARPMMHTRVAEPGYGGPRNTQSLLTHSDDGGRSWSEPRDITHAVRAPDAISVGSPGVGIVLTKQPYAGRILLPLYEVIPMEGDEEERYWRNRVAISDDDGASWRVSARAPLDQLNGLGNEAQLAALSDGSIRMHARLQGGANRVAWSVSEDGGEHWSPLVESPDLISTPCMTSIVAMPGTKQGRDVLLASLPYSESGREHGALLVSYDAGTTWTLERTIYPGGFAYSSLAILPDGRVACLFERGPYEDISFLTLDAPQPAGKNSRPELLLRHGAVPQPDQPK